MGNVKITIKVIRSKGKATIVEHNGERMIVPEESLHTLSDGSVMVNKSDLDAAIPYGISWEDELDDGYTVSRETLIHSLHEAGIWTYEDFVRSPDAVIGALHTAFGMTFASIAAIARRSRSNNL